MADHGPFETERQAHAAAIAEIPPEDGRSILSDSQNRQLIEDACAAAGVGLGAFDRRIVDGPGALADRPDEGAAEAWLQDVRRAYWDRE